MLRAQRKIGFAVFTWTVSRFIAEPNPYDLKNNDSGGTRTHADRDLESPVLAAELQSQNSLRRKFQISQLS